MWTVLGTIGIVIATIVLGLLADRKWGLLPSAKRLQEASTPKQLPGHAPGAAAATALEVTPAEQARLVGNQRCTRCRAASTLARDEPVTYDGRALRVLAFRCTRCGHTDSLYVEARPTS